MHLTKLKFMNDFRIIPSCKKQNDDIAQNQNIPQAETTIARLCYRKGFSPIDGFDSDKGWGCCYRCYQGIIANFLLRMNQDFPSQFRESFGRNPPSALFRDSPYYPFSIHSLVEKTKSQCGLKPGTWAKPSQLASISPSLFSPYKISVFLSNDFHINKSNSKIESFPVLMLFPSLFGRISIDSKYEFFLKQMINIDQSLGFISGKSGLAFYFVGYKKSKFLFFDPHVTYPAVGDNEDVNLFALPIKEIPFAQLNPSILLSFYAKDQNDFNIVIDTLLHTPESPFTDFEETDIDCIEF